MSTAGLTGVANAFNIDTSVNRWEDRVREQINTYVRPISLAYKDFERLTGGTVGSVFAPGQGGYVGEWGVGGGARRS